MTMDSTLNIMHPMMMVVNDSRIHGSPVAAPQKLMIPSAHITHAEGYHHRVTDYQ